MYLGKTESVGVTITLDEAPGSELRPLRIAVNVGSFSEIERVSAGTYKTVYVPPATRFPQVALVAVWRETGAEAPIAFLRIPLYGSTRLPIGAKRAAEVTVQVGELSFGPALVDKKGQLELPISVPPDIREATVNVKERSGSIATKKVPVDVPPYNRMTAALVPHAILSDGQSEARLDVFYDLGGADVPASRLKVTSSAGEARFVRAEKGLYVYRFRPPAGIQASEVKFDVSVEGDPAAKATAKVSLGSPPPARLILRPPAAAMPADGVSKATLEVIVFDEHGMGLRNQKLTVAANGKDLPAPSYQGSGVYRFSFVAPADYPAGGLVQLEAKTTAGPALETAANYQLTPPEVPSELVAQFSPSPIPANGRGSTRVRLNVRDAAGLPLRGAKLLVVASHGTLGPLTEEDDGRYTAVYQAPADVPDSAPELRVVDATGRFEQKVGLRLRQDPRRFLIGVRGGYSHSLQELNLPRLGADLSVPVDLGPTLMWLSLAANGWMAVQTVSDGTLSSRSTLLFIPVSLRVAFELWAGRRLAVLLGGGGGVTWARYSTPLTSRTSSAFGPNALGFAALHASVGPGHFFLEAGYTWSPVQDDGFRVEAGGVGFTGGYRLGIF